MPRYHFHHVHDGPGIQDHEGLELDNIRAAQREAVRRAGALLSENAGRPAPGEDWRLLVTDDVGLLLFRLDFTLLPSPEASAMLTDLNVAVVDAVEDELRTSQPD